MLSWNFVYNYLLSFKHQKCDRDLPAEKSNYDNAHSIYRAIEAYFKDIAFDRYTCDMYLNSLKGKSNSTKNNHLKMLKNIVGACDYYRVDVDITIAKIPYYKKNNLKQIDILTPDEIKRIAELRMPYRYSYVEHNRRYRAVIYTLALGLRVGEVQNLTWDDYKSDHFIITDGKTASASRRVYIPPKLKIHIDKLIHHSHNYIFGSEHGKLDRDLLTDDLRRRAKFLNINKRIYPHVFRHSFITNAIEQGQPLAFIAEHVGHKSYDVTRQYVHLGLKHTRQVVEAQQIYRSNMQEQLKDLLKNKIDLIYDKNRLKAIFQLLE